MKSKYFKLLASFTMILSLVTFSGCKDSVEDDPGITTTSSSSSSSSGSTLPALEAFIKADNAGADDQLGAKVVLNNDTLAVNAYKEDSNQETITIAGSSDDSDSNAGAVYIFARSGSTWSQQAYIKEPYQSNVFFGYEGLSLSGDTLALSQMRNDSTHDGVNYITTDATSDTSAPNSGAVFIYKRTGTSWALEAVTKPQQNLEDKGYGTAISLDGDTLAVGANLEDSDQRSITTTEPSDNNRNDSGAVYIYKRSGTTWSREAYIKSDNSDAADYFGATVALSGDTLAVGATEEDNNGTFEQTAIGSTTNNGVWNSGAVYVFTRSGTTWSQQAYIKPDQASAANEQFGNAIALDGDTLVVGVRKEDSSQDGITTSGSADNSAGDSGAVFVYKRTGTTWALEAFIKPDNSDANDEFGKSVSISGDRLVATAYLEDSNQTTITATGSADNSSSASGAVYVFKRSGTTWTQEAFIKSDNSKAGHILANSVSIHNNTIAAGVTNEDSNQTIITTTSGTNTGLSSSGAAYIYKYP